MNNTLINLTLEIVERLSPIKAIVVLEKMLVDHMSTKHLRRDSTNNEDGDFIERKLEELRSKL